MLRDFTMKTGGDEGRGIILGKAARFSHVCANCVWTDARTFTRGHVHIGGSRVLTTIRMCPCLLPVPRPCSCSGIQRNKTACVSIDRSFDPPIRLGAAVENYRETSAGSGARVTAILRHFTRSLATAGPSSMRRTINHPDHTLIIAQNYQQQRGCSLGGSRVSKVATNGARDVFSLCRPPFEARG